MTVNHEANPQGANRFPVSPGFEGAVRRAIEKPATKAPSHLIVPKSPRFFVERVNYVQDSEAAARMVELARQRSLSHIGIDTEFKFDRPGVAMPKGGIAYDPCSVHPLLLSLALVERTDSGGSLYRFVVDLRHPQVLPPLRKLLELRRPLVGHFLQAELFCLWRLGLPEPGTLWDTWVHEKAAHLGLHHKKYLATASDDDAEEAHLCEQAHEDEEFSLSLPATCLRHGVDYPFAGDKERLRQSFLGHPDDAPFSEEQIHYAAADAEAAANLYLPQVLEAAQTDTLQHLIGLEMPWVVTTARMKWRGVRVGQEKGLAVADAGHHHLASIEPQLEKFGIANVRSFPQLSEFFQRLGILELFRRDGRITFDKEQLKVVADRHPAIALINAARRILSFESEKILSGELVGADGRVHPDYRQLGAHTGRQTSRWPNVMGLGKVFRPLVVPEDGCGIGEADWSQVEVGIAAAVYGDDDLVAMFNTDDVYSAMAKLFFHDELGDTDRQLPGAEFKKTHRNKRDQMKTCTLGIIYGLSPHGLSLRLNTSEMEARRLKDRFMAMFPSLSQALAETPVYGALQGRVATVSGLRRYRARSGAPTNWERNWMVNYPVQGSASSVFKAAGNRLDKLYQQHGAWLIVPMHDAFVFEAPLAALSQVAELTERVMIDSVQEFFPQLRPKVEVNISRPYCWNKDGHADSLEQWMADPTYKL